MNLRIDNSDFFISWPPVRFGHSISKTKKPSKETWKALYEGSTNPSYHKVLLTSLNRYLTELLKKL